MLVYYQDTFGDQVLVHNMQSKEPYTDYVLVQNGQSKEPYIDYISPRCDFDIEDSDPRVFARHSGLC